MRAVFLDYGTVDQDDLDLDELRRILPELAVYARSDPREVAERTAEAVVILLNKAEMSRPIIESARALELIALTATGTNNIDLDAARERGVAVCNIRGYCTDSVAQHVFALILSLTQHLTDYTRLVSSGHWVGDADVGWRVPPIRELAGKTFGIVGWGGLGRAVARLGEAFGMRVLVAERRGREPRPGRVRLDELLRLADVVSLHCPLTAQSRGLIGAAELARMKPDALLINTARGALVDSRALVQALAAGRLGGAGIDVLAQEPPVDGDPLLDPGVPNLLVTPHVAWAAREARQRCLAELAENVRDFLRGGRRGRVV